MFSNKSILERLKNLGQGQKAQPITKKQRTVYKLEDEILSDSVFGDEETITEFNEDSIETTTIQRTYTGDDGLPINARDGNIAQCYQGHLVNRNNLKTCFCGRPICVFEWNKTEQGDMCPDCYKIYLGKKIASKVASTILNILILPFKENRND